MSGDVPLFGGFEPAEPEPVEELSAGQRLTRRQRQDVTNGRHPLTGQPIHPEATRFALATDPKGLPFTCGSCRFRDPGGYPKCVLPGSNGRPIPDRLTHGPATDVRAWWPACPDYQSDGRTTVR